MVFDARGQEHDQAAAVLASIDDSTASAAELLRFRTGETTAAATNDHIQLAVFTAQADWEKAEALARELVQQGGKQDGVVRSRSIG